MAKYIPLTKGKFALVDDVDYEFINQWKWCVNGQGYAKRAAPRDKNGKRKTILIHRAIAERMGLNIGGLEIDHINQNKLDNRRENLRVASRSANMRNRDLQKNSTSGLIGICWHKQHGKWLSRIKLFNKNFHLGYYDDPILAAEIRDMAALKYHGAFACLNFPDKINYYRERIKKGDYISERARANIEGRLKAEGKTC